MRIGIFDSGLGGLVIAKSVFASMPQHDYVYLGDTRRVPYGNRSQKQILEFTKQALAHLFLQDCKLVIIACNTSSAKALRKIQTEFLPKFYPDKKVLGVIVPTLEAIPSSAKIVGILATKSTTASHAYKRELLKIHPKTTVYEQAAPALTSLIEANRLREAGKLLKAYIQPLLGKKIQALVLGCTHYPLLKNQARKLVGDRVKIFSQEEIIPAKLKDYLKRHREIERVLSKNRQRIFEVTKINKSFKQVAKLLFGKPIDFKLVSL